MGQIDVSDILLDPDFAEACALIHRVPSVNSFGENFLTETTVNTFGCVQPASGKAIQRLPEALRIENLQTFWIKAPIVADATGAYTDVILWKGNRYNVKLVSDWTNWGEGWTEGLCVLEKPSL